MVDLEPLARFGAWVLAIKRGDLVTDDYNIQEAAVRHGLLEWVDAAGPCGPKCRCARWVRMWPAKCRRYTEAAKAALAKLEGKDGPT